jgi:Ca2+/Na+ antiporter
MPLLSGTLGFPLYFSFPFALILLIFASHCVGSGGEILGDFYDASLVGGILIAWLNTSPELIFFFIALSQKEVAFAIGAMSGSIIVVSTIAVGTLIVVGSLRSPARTFVLKEGVWRQCVILSCSVIFPVLMAIFRFQLGLAITGVIYYLSFLFYEMLKDKISFLKVPPEESFGEGSGSDDEELDDKKLFYGFVYLLTGAGIIVFFADDFINGVVEIASLLKINSQLLSFFIAPIASEMPEILGAIALARKGREGAINVGYSNLVGGTISKTTLILGILSFYGSIGDLEWLFPSFTVSCILISVAVFFTGMIGSLFRKQRWWFGLVLIIVFILIGIVQAVVIVELGRNDTMTNDTIQQ